MGLGLKRAFVTIDVEEWYHLEYLDVRPENRGKTRMVPSITDFLNVLDKYEIKATFFVLADIVNVYPQVIKEISKRGHEIGCHGINHDLLDDKDDLQFSQDILEAKKIIENLIGKDKVKGYRASCFSMSRSKIDILEKSGYRFDSSYIRFTEHPLYGQIDMTGFNKVDALVYKHNGFLEFEIPTLKIMGYNIPISGGGYMRLFPFWLSKILLRKYAKTQDNILFYLHPFEMTDKKIPFPENTSFVTKLRASVGRKSNIKKIEKLIVWLKKSGTEFALPRDYLA